MSTVRAVFNAVSDALIALLGLNRPVRLVRAFLDRIDAVRATSINGTRMRFDANAELHLLRADWLPSKEPETLEWIDGFAPGEVLYDIGANVGVFSVYAALHRGCDVYAFEPEAKNYACLTKNVYLNGLARRVKALNLALHDRTEIEYLQLHALQSGSALHVLGEPIDWRRERFHPEYEQSVMAFALDEFVECSRAALPHHIKLDVDGNESKILAGGRKTLSNPALKSVLVETGPDDQELVALLGSCGLRPTSRARPGSAGTCNIVFKKV